MKRVVSTVLAVWVAWSAAGCGNAMTGERELVLEDLLDRAWENEPVSFRLEAGEGECHVDSVRLSGPDGPAACQLSEVVFWPGTPFIKSAWLWFVTELAPLERRVYTARFGPEPAVEPHPEEDLRVERDAGGVEFDASGFGVRLSLGEEVHDEPVPAAEVPGPVRALRLGVQPGSPRAGGAWFGGSRLYGDTPIRGWSAELAAAGPVYGEARYRYEYADGNRLELTIRLYARSDRAQFDVAVADDMEDAGLRVVLSRGLPPLTLHVQKLFHHKRDIYPKGFPLGEWCPVPVKSIGPGVLHSVSPWGPWWDDRYAPVVRLGIGDLAREIHIARRDPAAWSPAHWRNMALPVSATAEGEVCVDIPLAPSSRQHWIGGSLRRFDIADSAPDESVGWRHRRNDMYDPPRRTGSQVIPYHEPLNAVKDYVLEWPRTTQHPRIFMSAEEIRASRPNVSEADLVASLKRGAGDGPGGHPHGRDRDALAAWLLTGDDELGRELRLADRLAHHLGLLGDFDKMRATVLVASLYDALIDSDLIEPARRRVLRAQMAYLAYLATHPATWSNERGWNSGNQNMTVSYSMQAPGTLAAALADHPLAGEWMGRAREVMDGMLDKVGPDGEWPESTGYSNLSVSELLSFAIVATRAGFADYLSDARLRRAVLHLVKIRQPPDPRTGGIRDHIRYGRSPGQTRALDGTLARAVLHADPHLSRQMQWSWQDKLEGGAPSRVLDLGGFEHLYLDPTLPSEAPDWGTERFRHMGAIFRRGTGTRREHFAALLSGDHPAMIYASQTGALASLFAYGRPVAGSFLGGYGDQGEFLVNRVSLARNPADYVAGQSAFHYHGAASRPGWWFDETRPLALFEQREGDGNVSAFSALPRQDYASVDVLVKYPSVTPSDKMRPPDDLPWPALGRGAGSPPLWWRRQVLFAGDENPEGTHYLLMRDTVSGGQPTQWTFWTASERVGTAAEAADRETFLADAPGQTIVSPRELSGDRFTALGAWGVDLEIFVAEPSGTPRHTLRWGKRWNVSRPWGVSQYQDLLHLQRAGDGIYFVALFPREADDASAVPVFSAAGGGTVIRVEGAFGTDWGFLSARHAEAAADGVVFSGTAGSVQDRDGRVVLSLGAAGRVSRGGYGVESEQAVSLGVGPEKLTLDLPRGHEGVTLTLRAPGMPRLAFPSEGVSLTPAEAENWTVEAAAGVARIELER